MFNFDSRLLNLLSNFNMITVVYGDEANKTYKMIFKILLAFLEFDPQS
jgi:hypothetical protein